MFRTRVISVLVSGVLVASLAPLTALAQDDPAAAGQASVLEGTVWSLSRYVGADGTLADVPVDVSADLLLQDDVASGSAGCNTFQTTYVVDGSALTIGGEDGAIALTQVLCEGDAQVVEDAYMAALPGVASWSIVDGSLQLSDADGSVILAFDDGSIALSVSDFLGLNDQIIAQAAVIAELTARVADLEGTDATPTTQKPKKAPKGPRVDQTVERKFAELQAEEDRGLIEWTDRARNEDGYNVHARRIQCVRRGGEVVERPSKWVRVARLPANTESYVPVHAEIVAAIEPQNRRVIGRGSLYELAVSAHNELGRSKLKLAGAYILAPEYGCP